MDWKIDNTDYSNGFRNEHGVRVWKLKTNKHWRVSGVGVPMGSHLISFATAEKAQRWVIDNIQITTTNTEPEVNTHE